MRSHSLLGPWVRRFLLEHLVAERNLARNTQVSYRDTLALLLPFISRKAGAAVDRLMVDDVSADRVREFLDHVERDRGCAVLTRNHRLAAIHSLARFIGARSPEHVSWCSQVRSVPFKKATKTVIGYLDKHEVDALLRIPDRRTVLGVRDHALLLFLYNSGARADEAASLCVNNLHLGSSPSVRILGKGNKWRVCPLWPKTADSLRPIVVARSQDDRVFRWRTGPADDEIWSTPSGHVMRSCCADGRQGRAATTAASGDLLGSCQHRLDAAVPADDAGTAARSEPAVRRLRASQY